MPEGPSLVILKEEIMQFKGKKVLALSGSVKGDVKGVLNKKVLDIKTWGKHLLICFKDVTIRVHLMMFGTYLINGKKKTPLRLGLKFTNGTVNFYTCSVKLLEGPLDEFYDFSEDIMSRKWNTAAARKKLKEDPDTLVCDALLDQHIFSGSGNIIKNEVLFRTRVHPLSKTGSLPTKKLSELVRETSKYAFDFLKWKKKDQLDEHWQAYSKKTCPRCAIPLHKEYLGKTKRRTFFCNNCQELYG